MTRSRLKRWRLGRRRRPRARLTLSWRVTCAARSAGSLSSRSARTMSRPPVGPTPKSSRVISCFYAPGFCATLGRNARLGGSNARGGSFTGVPVAFAGGNARRPWWPNTSARWTPGDSRLTRCAPSSVRKRRGEVWSPGDGSPPPSPRRRASSATSAARSRGTRTRTFSSPP